jgi:hypothetical protein
MKINLKLLFLPITFAIGLPILLLFSAQAQSSILSSQFSPSSRQIVHLNGQWDIKEELSDENWLKTTIPFASGKSNTIILQKRFSLPKSGNPIIYSITFENVVGLKEIYINETKLAFDPSEIPWQTYDFPARLVREGSDNWLRVELSNKSEIKHIQTLASKVLLPSKIIGIYKEPYITISPAAFLGEIKFFPKIDENKITGSVDFQIEIFKNLAHKIDDNLLNYQIEVSLYDESQLIKINSEGMLLNLKDKNQHSLRGSLSVKNPNLWTPENPNLYFVQVTLLQKDSVVDESYQPIGFRDVKFSNNKFYLNGYPYEIKGVTYFLENIPQFSPSNEQRFIRDIQLIKDLGANAVRVINSLPSKEFVYECDKEGILLFVDIDSKKYTETFFEEEKNRQFLKHNISHLHNFFSGSPSIAAINFGFANSRVQLENLVELIKLSSSKNTSYLNFYTTESYFDNDDDRIDFIGIETNRLELNVLKRIILILKETNKNFLISSFGYSHLYNVNEGYSNPYSVQAQAKYISEGLDFFQKDSVAFFVNTMFDYRLPYHSVVAGDIDNTLYSSGLINEYRDKQKISYKVVESYFKNEKLLIITEGDFSDDKNVIFVFFGIGLIISLVLLIKSTRRFREYATRALLKTYNFFSDIRDARIVSTFQTTLLAIIVTTSISLLHSGVLFYHKDKIAFERFISLFNSKVLFELISYLAWRPLAAILYGSIFCFILIICITLLIKFLNLFVRTKIFLSHAYSLTVWSIFPFVMSIPLGVAAYKVLLYQQYNIFVYALIILFHLWILMRLIKGISIIFEVKKLNVQIPFVIILVGLIAGLFTYFELTGLFWDYFNFYFIY